MASTTKVKVKRFNHVKRLLPIRRARVLLPSPLLCIFLASLVWGFTILKLHDERYRVEHLVYKQASALTVAYAAQLTQAVDQIHQLTLNLKYFWETYGPFDLEAQVARGLYPASDYLYVTITNRHGKIVTSTFPGVKRGDLSGGFHFRTHQSDHSQEMLIGKPGKGLSIDKTVIRLSRRLDTADGVFDGIIVVGVEPVFLASFIDESSLGDSDFLSVENDEGTVLVTKIGERARSLPNILRSPPALEWHHGTIRMSGAQFADDQTRIVSWQRLENYPLVARVGLSEQDAFAAYEAMASDYRRMAVISSVLLLLLGVTGMLFSSHLASRKHQADEVKEAYRLATDGAREGFYMVRPIYGEDDSLIDLLFEECNERGGILLGLAREQLIGKRLSDYFAPPYVKHVLGIASSVMEAGFYQEEFRVPPDNPLRGRWMYHRFVRSGGGIAVTLRDISESKAHEEALSYLANTDVLTALPNRHWLVSYLPRAVSIATHRKALLAVLFVDLDDFKNINDTLGHAAGDELLQGAALRLKHIVRPHDNVVRLGGDEFTIILQQVDSDDDVARLAERIVEVLGEPFSLAGTNNHVVRASIGISMFPRDGSDGETLLKHADVAMYAAKANGKGTFAFYEPHLSERLLVRLNREQALRQAIECDEMVVHYQPRVDTFSGELRSLEALVRWVHPELGLVLPQAFIPIAEDTGLIIKLGELVVEKVFAQLAQWKLQNLPLVPVSINVSARQFNERNLSELFASRMAHYGIESSLLEIEITESCMIEDDGQVNEQLTALDALGIKLLVDDFGTGYSSLSQLQRLELNGLKIDKAFTAALDKGSEGEVFFKAILSMANELGMNVVAEGVETASQLHVLQALSCNEVQGDFISPSMPGSEIPSILRKQFLFPPFGFSLQAVNALLRHQQLFLGI